MSSEVTPTAARQNQPELVEDLIEFLRTNYRNEVGKFAQTYPSGGTIFEIDYSDLYTFDVDFAEDCIEQPETAIPHLTAALHDYDLPVDVDLSRAKVALTNTPDSAERNIKDLRWDDTGTYRSIVGQVGRATPVRPKLTEAAFECRMCKTITRVPQPENGGQEPHQCVSCDRQGPFTVDLEQSDAVNHQMLRINPLPEEATDSAAGDHIDVHLKGDLAGTVEAGARVRVNGILDGEVEDFDSANVTYYHKGESIERIGEDFSELNIEQYKDRIENLASGNESIQGVSDPFDILRQSIAPKLQGSNEITVSGDDIASEDADDVTRTKLEWIKQSLVMQQFGGWRRESTDGSFERGDSHMLLIGDPSTGKSSLLGIMEQIAPRSSSASGKGASAAGLTAAATKDDFGDEQWSLKAGALVKANGGLATIDEIDKVESDALSSLHSALEKQRLEVNKAGMDATLKAETALLAAGNPKHSRFDATTNVQDQIEIVSSLMDRFDIVFSLRDIPELGKDKQVAESVVGARTASGKRARDDLVDDTDGPEPMIDADLIRNWIAYARRNVFPVIEDEAVMDRIERWYAQVRQRNSAEDDGPVPASVRKLDAVLRLSEASARVRLSDTVEMEDADRAIRTVMASLKDVGIDPNTGDLDIDILETGQSMSQKERVESITEAIDHLDDEDENGSGADEDEVISYCVDELGMDHGNVEHEIQKLRDKGEVYSPRRGRLDTI